MSPGQFPTASSEGVCAENDTLFYKLFEQSPDPIFVETLDGEVLDVNPAACALHRCKREDLIGSSVAALVPESEREPVLASFLSWASGELTAFDGWSHTLDGRNIPVEIRGCRIDFSGRPAILLHVRDMSERKRSFDSLRDARDFAESLIQNTPTLLIGLDASGVIRLFNRFAEQLTGYASPQVVGRLLFEKFVPPHLAADASRRFHQFVKEGQPSEWESPLVTRDGAVRTIAWRHTKITDSHYGEMIIATGVDLTDQREIERSRTLLEGKLLEAQKLESLGVLAGGVAHDFNNLLTTILGNASLIKLELGGDLPQREQLEAIEETALQAADLCKQLLDYAGRGSFQRQSIDINLLIQQMRAMLNLSVAKNILLQLDLDATLPLISADPAQIRQIVMNLVINASEAIGEKDGVISLRTSVSTCSRRDLDLSLHGAELRAGTYVQLTVSDNGCGMSEAVRNHIFDPFFTTKFTGRGIGLAAVSGIVRSHGGCIDVQNNAEEGATFRVDFPIAPIQTAPPVAEPLPDNDWSYAGPGLFVDDEESVRMLGERLLESFGCEVLTAADGLEAVEVYAAHSNRIRFVVLDVTMPRMSGRDAFQQIRQQNPTVPVLFISGYANAIDQAQLDENTDFLAKPFRMEEFRGRLRRLLT